MKSKLTSAFQLTFPENRRLSENSWGLPEARRSICAMRGGRGLQKFRCQEFHAHFKPSKHVLFFLMVFGAADDEQLLEKPISPTSKATLTGGRDNRWTCWTPSIRPNSTLGLLPHFVAISCLSKCRNMQRDRNPSNCTWRRLGILRNRRQIFNRRIFNWLFPGVVFFVMFFVFWPFWGFVFLFLSRVLKQIQGFYGRWWNSKNIESNTPPRQ